MSRQVAIQSVTTFWVRLVVGVNTDLTWSEENLASQHKLGGWMFAVLGWLDINELMHHHLQVLLLLVVLDPHPLPPHLDVQQGPSQDHLPTRLDMQRQLQWWGSLEIFTRVAGSVLASTWPDLSCKEKQALISLSSSSGEERACQFIQLQLILLWNCELAKLLRLSSTVSTSSVRSTA